MEILDGSVAAQDGRLRPHDRILSINDIDVRYARLDLALRLIQQTYANINLIVCSGVTGSRRHSPSSHDLRYKLYIIIIYLFLGNFEFY